MTLVLVHGAWMNPASWEAWSTRLRARGHEVLAPAWPYDDRPPAELRASPAPELAGVGVAEILTHYETAIRALPEPPALIGHSFGGLFVQLLLQRGLGRVGVAIDPAPPKGVLPTFDAIRAAFPVVSKWGGGSMVHQMAFADFQWGWVHTLPEAEQRRAFDTFVVPTPGKVYFDALRAPFTSLLTLEPARRAQPLLMIAGLEDRTVPASMVRAAHRLQQASPAPTELRELPGRTHWIVAQPGWEEVCDLAADWVEAQT